MVTIIRSLRELAEQDPDWQKRLHDLFWILIQDVPTPVPHARRPLEAFIQVHLTGPGFRAAAGMGDLQETPKVLL